MIIRKASTDEAETLSKIAHSAQQFWGYPEHWIAHWQNELTFLPEYMTANQVYVADNDGRLVGFYALIAAAPKPKLDHLWVDPASIDTGVGKELFLHAMRKAAGED